MSAITILANYKDENPEDYTTETVKGYTFINTAGHGYLCLGSDDNGYSQALRIARSSNYSYVLEGLAFLEEDCDANEFLALGMDNLPMTFLDLGIDNLPMTTIKATDYARAMGITVWEDK